MNFLSPDNNILDLLLWRGKKSSDLKKNANQKSEALIAYYQALGFEQIIQEADEVSKNLEHGQYNLKHLKDALILLSEIESRIEEDNSSLSNQVKKLISDLDRRVENLKQ